MKISMSIFCAFLCASLLSAQDAPVVERQVFTLQAEQNKTLQFEGKLEDGMTMPLRWAENSSMACFPGTRFVEYQGNHVLYRMVMPAYSDLKITVKPKDPKHRINIYALRLGANNMGFPPNLSSAISCEAGYPIYAGTPNFEAPAEERSVSYISVNRPYNILIGVAGAKGFTSGDYILEVALKER